MLDNKLKGIAEGFELPGSKPQFSPSLNFNIEYMSLTIEPKLKGDTKNLINCSQKLKIKTKQDLNEIELDIAELKIHDVSLLPNINMDSKTNTQNSITDKILEFDITSKVDKLIIKLREIVKKDKVINIRINYSAGYDIVTNQIRQIRSGFHFLELQHGSQDKEYQAWTQGETIESRYWFPCLDDPQVKFKREIHVIVPENYEVISNGIVESKSKIYSKEDDDSEGCPKVEWIWKEDNPNPAYLTSVVIGKFMSKREDYIKLPLSNGNNLNKEKIPLLYYWTNDIEQKGYDPMLTYRDTSNVIKFFEEYLQTNYAFKKYSQVAVDDFDFGGMENTSCTTLTKDFFHDINVLPDYTFDVEVVRHEIAHQWFGDLVTCRDWQHLWLNEGFATYFTILFLDKEHILDPTGQKNRNEFFYNLLLKMDEYFFTSGKYKRPIVTNVYKHPDDLFDDHAYEKGGCVLHMLRNYIGEDNFRQSLKIYLEKFKYKSAETDDLRKVFEEVSGLSLQQFFDQWLYKAGHPVLKIKISFKKVNEKFIINLNVTQVKEEKSNNKKEELIDENEAFSFPLDFKLYFLNDKNYENKTNTFSITSNANDFVIEFDESKMKNLKFISIDPELKILKVIKSIEIEENSYDFNISKMLRYQLKDGDTVIERIDAARLIANSKDTSNWKTIGEDKFLPDLPKTLTETEPTVLVWQWNVPLTESDNIGLLVIIDSPEDPIPEINKVFEIKKLVMNERHVGLRTVHSNLSDTNFSN